MASDYLQVPDDLIGPRLLLARYRLDPMLIAFRMLSTANREGSQGKCIALIRSCHFR